MDSENNFYKFTDDTKPIRILMVDDEPETLEIFSHYILRRASFKLEIELCENGKIALECYENKQFDLVISDINMPEINGITLAKIIRSKDNIPIIFFTAFDSFYLEGELESADLIIQKPGSAELLFNGVIELLEKYSLIQTKS